MPTLKIISFKYYRDYNATENTIHVTNATVGETTMCHSIFSLSQRSHLHFFRHVAQSDSKQVHYWAVSAIVSMKKTSTVPIHRLNEGDRHRQTTRP